MSNKIIALLQSEWKYFVGLAITLALLIFSYTEYREWKQHVFAQAEKNNAPVVNVTTSGAMAKPNDLQLVYLQGASTVTHEVAYVPKETVAGKKETTDITLDSKKAIHVRVNGKDVLIPDNVTENSKFENGKLVLTEQQDLRLNISTPRPVLSVGIVYGKNKLAGIITGPLSGSVGWWAYGDRQNLAGGLTLPIFK